MKKIRIIESELIDLIEKLVKENIGNGTGFNFGMLGTPTSKYKELEETEAHGEFNTESGDEGEEVTEVTLDVNVDDETQDGLNQEDFMESITESQLISRLKRRLVETTVGCANKPAGCIREGSYTHTDEDTGEKTTYPWHILNNKKDGIWRGCSSEENCKEQLAAIHV